MEIIGRNDELARLKKYYKSGRAEFIAIYGRHTMISIVLLYETLENLTRDENGGLSKNILTFVHNHCG